TKMASHQFIYFLVMVSLMITNTSASKTCHPDDLKGLNDFKAGIHSDTSGHNHLFSTQNGISSPYLFSSNGVSYDHHTSASKTCHPDDLKGLNDFKAGIHSDTRSYKWIGEDLHRQHFLQFSLPA
ncbi:hypothetical protein HAX54_006797, partial [Datura stramonium]|nr:hypothetical protein [Datura stramonium]